MTMPVTESERQYLRIFILIAALLVVVVGALYLDQRQSLAEERAEKFKAVNDAQAVFTEQATLRKLLAGWGGTVTGNPSEAEGRLLHFINDAQQQAGMHNPSFQRIAAAAQNGFETLTYEITVEGPGAATAGLIYKVESAPIPLRVDDMQVHSKNDSGDLEIHLKVSTLCRAAQNVEPEQAQAEEQLP